MMTTWPPKIACPLLAPTKVDSFWIVVMMILALGSSICRFNTAVEVFELAAPFSNRSYSRMVW